jgi:hypothetical protein
VLVPGDRNTGGEHAVPREGGRFTARIGPVAIGLLALRIAVVVVTLYPGHPAPHADDLARFREIVATPGTPYRTFEVEYAPGEVLFLKIFGSSDPRALANLIVISSFFADIGCWLALWYGWGAAAAQRYLWVGAPLLVFIYTRFDLIPVMLSAWGAALAIRGSQRSGGSLFAVAILTKLWPLALLPAFILARRLHAFAWALGAAASGALAWLWLGGPRGISQVLTFRGATGWGVSSTVGTLVWILTGGPVRLESGAPRVGSMQPWESAIAVSILVLVMIAIWLKAASRGCDPLGSPACAALCALIACSPLFSVQFASWLLPWACVAWADGQRITFRIVTWIAVLTGIFYVVYDPTRVGASQLVALGRNAVVVAVPVWWLLSKPQPALTADTAVS